LFAFPLTALYAKEQKQLIFVFYTPSFGLGYADKSLNFRVMRLF